MSVDPTRHFPADYRAARSAFLSAAERRRARLTSHPIRARGPRGEELAIDTAYVGPTQPRSLIIVTSGTHGVEGFTGSAVQHRFLTEQLDGFEAPGDMGLLLIHAVNPYGFAHLRRVNENNVDLNRNFLKHPEEHVPNPGYELLFEAINPRSLDEESEQVYRTRLLEFAREHGARRLQEVLSCGQYAHATGMQFGGIKEEESNRCIRRILRTEGRGAARVAWVDLHTGLGPYAEYEIISQAPPDDPVYLRGRRWYGDAARSTLAGDSVTPHLFGDILDGALSEFDDAVEVTPIAPEFGTYDLNRVFSILRADNWLYCYGDLGSEQGGAIKEELVEVFRPASFGWQTTVLERSAAILEQTRDGLAGAEK